MEKVVEALKSLEERQPKRSPKGLRKLMREKLDAASKQLAKQSLENAKSKALAALRQTPAADGAAMVQMIKQATGTDLSTALAPRFN